jgi:hypothetical protein
LKNKLDVLSIGVRERAAIEENLARGRLLKESEAACQGALAGT